MSLGFTVNELVLAGRRSGGLRTELVRLAETEWLWRNFDRKARAAVFARFPDSVMQQPGADGAAQEAAQLVANRASLRDAAAAVWEDLCVLEADRRGQFRLTAAAVGFPTEWRLAEKFGLALGAMHMPLHGHAAGRSTDGIDHFFRTMPSGAIFGRTNRFVVASDDWRYLPDETPAARFAHVTADNAGTTLFLRCERQTFRRLPESGAVLVTIGIARAPLGALRAAVVGRIADDVCGMSGGEQERRAAPLYRAALSGYAARRAAELENAA